MNAEWYRTVSGTELRVSPICIGTWQFSGTVDTKDSTWDYQEESVYREIVSRALELGINCFDSAEAYGNHHAEGVLGRALAGRRQDAVIATKFGRFESGQPKVFEGTDIEQSLHKSLQALQTDYVDIYQIHWAVNVKDPIDAVQTLERLKATGKLRHYALSNFGPLDIGTFVASNGKPVLNQLPYNLLWRAIEFDVIPACMKHDIGILAYSPLAQGLLSGRFSKPEEVPEGRRRSRHFSKDSTSMSRHGESGAELETFSSVETLRAVCKEAGIPMTSASLSWLLAQPQVVSCIVGARTAKQVEENARLQHLSKAVLEKLSAATEGLKSTLGPNPDMWAATSRYH